VGKRASIWGELEALGQQSTSPNGGHHLAPIEMLRAPQHCGLLQRAMRRAQ